MKTIYLPETQEIDKVDSILVQNSYIAIAQATLELNNRDIRNTILSLEDSISFLETLLDHRSCLAGWGRGFNTPVFYRSKSRRERLLRSVFNTTMYLN